MADNLNWKSPAVRARRAVLVAFGLGLALGMWGSFAEPAEAARVIENNVPPLAGGGGIHRNSDKSIRGLDKASSRSAVIQFLGRRGRTAATLNSLQTGREFSVGGSGRRVVEFGQQVNGLTVYNARAKAVFGPDGTLELVSDGLAPVRGQPTPAGIDSGAALTAAMGRVFPGVSAALEELSRSGNSVTYAGSAFFYRDPVVTRVAIPGSGESLAEGFLVETWSAEGNQLYYTLVDGEGQVVYVENRTANDHDRYNVFKVSPGESAQEIVQPPAQIPNCADPGFNGTVPSPCGWWRHGADEYDLFIHGPNSETYLDDDANDAYPDISTLTVIGDGQYLTEFDDAVQPTTPSNREVVVQNLWYLTNLIHDVLYQHGFTETEGNFQNNNFGRGGAQWDALRAEAQDGSGTNNANITVPDDGTSPVMQMYLTTFTTPNRDTGLDSDVVWHEYGHGLNWRVIKNMTGHFSGAIGEGSGDSLAIIMNNEPRVGEWSFADPDGIRSAPYEGYLEATGRTYNDWTTGEVHSDGEIFGAIMWDVWKRYCPDGATCQDDAAKVDAARDQLMTDIVEGQKLTTYLPDYPTPTPPSMRDGMLYAVSGDPDPLAVPADSAVKQRWCNVWEAFAKFGVGTDQTTEWTWIFEPLIGQWDWFEGFAIPAACDAVGNTAPTFTADPMTGAQAQEGVAYVGSIAGSATDPDVGDTLTYSKVAGPAWLVVASDGALSGTPGSGDVGANAFTVGVNDGNGGTDQATLNIDVAAATPTNNPPGFTTDPITGDPAQENAAYSASIAGSATDPDVGDTLNYYKVSGPAWLVVASNGALSGTPGSSDVGANAFTVGVNDGNGGSDEATLNIDVAAAAPQNNPPSFTTDPMTGDPAEEGVAYAGSIAGSATDPDAGDTLNYSKVSGPAWLVVASDGTLSGTPGSGDVGANAFTVGVNDGNGGSDQATLNIEVTASAPALVADFTSNVDSATGVVTLTGTPTDGDTYTWVIESWPGGWRADPNPSLTNDTNPATFTATKSGDYVVTLTVIKGGESSSKTNTVSVSLSSSGGSKCTGGWKNGC